MGLTTGDFDNDGDMDIMSTNVILNAGQRIAASTVGLLPKGSSLDNVLEEMRTDYKGMMLYQNNGDGSFTDITHSAGIKWEGQAAAAGEWVDYNHDGLLDYYLPNGLWSSGEKAFDSLFMRAEMSVYESDAQIDLQDDEKTESIPNDIHGGATFEANGGPNPILTVLRNHREEIDGKLTYSIGGSQHNSLFRNNGDGTFTEVGYLENADRVEDGYIVAPVDIDNDGKTDLVLRNTDPAPENSYPSVVALKNTRLNDRTVILKFASKNGNVDVVGLIAVAEINGKKYTREIRAVNGAVQAEPSLTFGLQSSDAIDLLTLKWPGASGKTMTLKNIKAGQHLIKETAEVSVGISL